MQTDLTDIVLLLDRSGSMEVIRDDMIGAINSFLDAQKMVPGRANFSLYVFDTVYEPRTVAAELASIQPFTRNDLVPCGGTALLDAMGRCIIETGDRLGKISEDQRPGKVVFVAVTDGQENSSHEFDNAKVKEMVKHQSDTYAWQFMYLGANQDAFSVAAAMGVPTSNVLNYNSTPTGTKEAGVVFSAGVARYRSGATPDCAFTDDEKSLVAKA